MNEKNTENLKLLEKELINKAITFHEKGNISEAVKNYKLIIDKGLNDPRVFHYYGLILRQSGKRREAEILIRRAIELEPQNIFASYNLSVLLRELNKLQEAEKIARKVIKYKPDLAEVHYNLATILKDIGKLKEAEISSRRAIELKTHLVEAHYILNNILMDLGKLKELIDLSQATLKLEIISQGDRLVVSLMITIAYLLLGDLPNTLLNMNKTNTLLDQGAINTIINKKTKNHILTFSHFISRLFPQLEKNVSKLKKIPHIGESHCLSFSHQTLRISSNLRKIQPVLITGGKAWHFAINKNNQWKDSLTQQMKNHNYSDEVFVSFGEIDCRKDQGILSYVIKNSKDIAEVCEKTVINYLNYMEESLAQNYSTRYYFGTPAPLIINKLRDELDLKRIEIIKTFNACLKKEVLSRGSFFLDVLDLTSNEYGENNNLHMCDKIHLSPKCLNFLFDNHLYKP
ncbi:MAG: tetratricopeptide repeat protein [Alphaproteobacteria bacterium]